MGADMCTGNVPTKKSFLDGNYTFVNERGWLSFALWDATIKTKG